MYVVIVGAGDIGSQLIGFATRESHDVVVVERDETVANSIAQNYDCLVMNRDATTMDALVEAGGDRADAIISTTESDATNVMVMLLAQELEIPSQVSVVQDAEHMTLFRRLGVNVLENPERLIAEYLYRAVQRPSIKDFMHLSGEAEIFEITVTEKSPVAGRTLADADETGTIPDDVRIVAVERNHSVLLPQGDTRIQDGDLVTVFSKQGFNSEIIRTFVGDES
ncbi:potassium channel family protein [Halorussus salinisoli]|uniref:potassium channel family protein n=1 Tax=Halorussus salinisoli TaxID=2558242 RepID=UPI0010C1C24B|nr:TrkA family potassium uptake protein [Halorussus salinisoli]